MRNDVSETPERQRRRRWLQLGLRTLVILALFGIVLRYVWVRFVRGSTLSGVIQELQDLAPEAEKRNQTLRDLTNQSAGDHDK